MTNAPTPAPKQPNPLASKAVSTLPRSCRPCSAQDEDLPVQTCCLVKPRFRTGWWRLFELFFSCLLREEGLRSTFVVMSSAEVGLARAWVVSNSVSGYARAREKEGRHRGNRSFDILVQVRGGKRWPRGLWPFDFVRLIPCATYAYARARLHSSNHKRTAQSNLPLGFHTTTFPYLPYMFVS
jgi:hypothetical protein